MVTGARVLVAVAAITSSLLAGCALPDYQKVDEGGGGGGSSGGGGGGSSGGGGGGGAQGGLVVSQVSIDGDTNDDGVVSPGETGGLQITIENTGTSEALGIQGTLTTSNTSVTITRGSPIYFGDIQGGSTACGNTYSSGQGGYCIGLAYEPTFSVPVSVSVGTVIPFSLALTDTNSNHFALSFNYTVGGINQVFTIVTTSIDGDTNGDGVVSPGETGGLQITIENTGTSEALGIQGTLTTSNTSVTITRGSPIYFGDIQGGSTACGNTYSSGQGGYCIGLAYEPTFSVPVSVSVGTVIPFSLALTDTNSNHFALSFNYTVGGINQVFTIVTTSIDGDTNGDGVVSPGETGGLQITIENTGTSEALGIQGTLTTSNTSVTITRGSPIYFGDIQGGSTACGNTYSSGQGGYCIGLAYEPTFSVPVSVSVGTVIPFSLALTDTNSNHFALSFNYTVGGINQVFTIVTTSIDGDTNGDGVVSPGETGGLQITIENTGTSEALGIQGTLTTSGASVTITRGSPIYFGDIQGGSTACGNTYSSGQGGYCIGLAYEPTFSVPVSVSVGTVIPFSLALHDAYNNSFMLSFSYTVGSS